MEKETKRRLTIVSSNEELNVDISKLEREKRKDYTTPPDLNYHTNPMYEKLLNFKESQKKKRFTVDDLLKW
jgi:hypothetical protein